MRISDWSSDVCSSDLRAGLFRLSRLPAGVHRRLPEDGGAGHQGGGGGPSDPHQRAAPAYEQGGHRARSLSAGAGHGIELVLLRSDAGRQALRPVRQLPTAVQGFRGSGDRKSVVEGKSVAVRVELGGRRIIKKNKENTTSKNKETKNKKR